MNRVRAGLTGLALVFVMGLLAAALFGPVGLVAPAEGPSETLATLGVAPGAEVETVPEPVVPAPESRPMTPEELFNEPPLPAIPADPNAEADEMSPIMPPPVEGELTEI
ncbi:MAG: hypothetical protein AAGD40_08540 [Pseudomonadota bacterium]